MIFACDTIILEKLGYNMILIDLGTFYIYTYFYVYFKFSE